MNLSQREKTIALITGVAVGLLLLNYVLISPLLAQRDEALDSIDTATTTLAQTRDLIHSRPFLERQLADNVGRGLTHDQSEAESQLLSNIRQWAQDAGLSLATIKPAGLAQTVNRPGKRAGDKEKAFLKLTCGATGNGNMGQISRFVWKIQTAATPVRITKLTMSSHKEGTDDLEVNLEISTIFLAPDTINGAAAETAPARTARPAASAPASRPGGAR